MLRGGADEHCVEEKRGHICQRHSFGAHLSRLPTTSIGLICFKALTEHEFLSVLECTGAPCVGISAPEAMSNVGCSKGMRHKLPFNAVAEK